MYAVSSYGTDDLAPVITIRSLSKADQLAYVEDWGEHGHSLGPLQGVHRDSNHSIRRVSRP